MSHHHVWTKTFITRDGDVLIGTTYAVIGGQPAVVRRAVNLREIQNELVAVGGFFDDPIGTIGKVAKKIGRTKLIKDIGDATKSVVRSKITGAVALGLSAFPLTAPVGAGALAAYATANKALDVYEEGQKAAKAVSSAASTIKGAGKLGAAVKTQLSAAKKFDAAQAKFEKLSPKMRTLLIKSLKKTPEGRAKLAKLQAGASAKGKLDAFAKAGGAAVIEQAGAKAKVAKRVIAAASQPKGQNAIATAVRRGQEVADKIAETRAKALAGDFRAKKAMEILAAVQKNRLRLKAVADAHAGGRPGLLIDNQGRLRKGKFVRKPSKGVPAVLYTKDGAERGEFTKIGCDCTPKVGQKYDCIPMPVRV